MNFLDRLSKHIPIVGDDGIEKIRNMRLTIIGVSGNGSPLALMAVLVGVVRIVLVDPDRLEETNRNRFLFGGRWDVGKFKVDVAKEHLDRIDAEMECIALPTDVRSRLGRSALRDCDVVASAVDSNEAREFLQQQCSALGKPLLDLGSGAVLQEGQLRMLGSRASLYTPGGACLYHQTLDASVLALSPVSFVTSNVIAAAVGLELLLGWLTGYGEPANFALYDSLKHSLTSMTIAGSEDCRYCRDSQQHAG